MNIAVSPIQQIDAVRIERGITVEKLAPAAGLSRTAYHRILSGETRPRASTIARLKAALNRLAGRPAELAAPYSRVVLYCYFAVLGIVCMCEGVDVRDVHRQDPARKATADPAWQRAAQLRRQAIYLVNTALGISQTDIAKAIGQTPAAISLACKAGENRLDDPAFESAIAELTRIISGGEFG